MSKWRAWRKLVRLDLILVMACHLFWIWDLQTIFWYSRDLPMKSWDKLVQFLGDAGLKLNAEKTVLITTQAQPPPFLTTSTGAVIKVKEKETGHKWLGCMLSAAGSKNAILDIDYHLQSASRAFLPTNGFFWAEMYPSETNWSFSMPSWHQSLVLELGPDASTMQIWPNLISTFDVWSEAWLELQTRSAGAIRGTKFCISGINVCEKSWEHSFHFKASRQWHMGMAHRRSIGAVRNKRIVPRFSTALSWKTRPHQGQHPRPHRLQVCTPWTPRNSLGVLGAAAVQQSGAEGFDQKTRTAPSHRWKARAAIFPKSTNWR